MKEIVDAKLVVWYSIGDENFIQHPNWTKYQYLRNDMYKKSTIPPAVTVPLHNRNETRHQVIKKERKKESENLYDLKKYKPKFLKNEQQNTER